MKLYFVRVKKSIPNSVWKKGLYVTHLDSEFTGQSIRPCSIHYATFFLSKKDARLKMKERNWMNIDLEIVTFKEQ